MSEDIKIGDVFVLLTLFSAIASVLSWSRLGFTYVTVGCLIVFTASFVGLGILIAGEH